MTDYGRMAAALRPLGLQWQNWQASQDLPGMPVLDREAIAESVIHRFETAYDVSWKTLKRHLTEVYGVVEMPSSPKPVFRIADDNGLLEGCIAEWLRYADARTAVAHDYSESNAGNTLELAGAFHGDAVRLLERLTIEASQT